MKQIATLLNISEADSETLLATMEAFHTSSGALGPTVAENITANPDYLPGILTYTLAREKFKTVVDPKSEEFSTVIKAAASDASVTLGTTEDLHNVYAIYLTNNNIYRLTKIKTSVDPAVLESTPVYG